MYADLTDSEKRSLRHAAFIADLAVRLQDLSGNHVGPKVVQLTPWRANLLALHGSPYISWGPATRLQLLQALYLLSPGFVIGGQWRFCLFVARWWFLISASKADAALRRWMKAQLLNAASVPRVVEPGEGPPTQSIWWPADFIRSCMKALSLSEAEVLHMPYNRLFAYIATETSTAPDMPKFDEDTKKIGAYLRAKNANKTVS